MKRVDSNIRELEPLRFRFKGKVARLLGRESVSNAVVALSELVKNAYDADATEVVVSFENIGTMKGRIRIKDNGTGMSYEDFKERWMVVGTDYKERKRVTPSGRRMIGEKGIGRFAVERLARKIEIVSNVKESENELHVIIDWDEYESEESFFDKVENRVFTKPKRDPDEHGLELILSGLRDLWDEPDLLTFRRQMSMLVPPVVLKESDFSVVVRTPDFPGLSGEIENVIFREAFYTVTATLKPSGKVTCKIVDRKGKESVERMVTEKTSCGSVKFTLYFYPRGFKKDERSQYRILRLQEIRTILDNFHGIRIYRDGFRVKPYGDPGDDWLNLNLKRLYGPRYLYPDNRQVIGIVEIARDRNPQLVDTTTREGLIQNRAFRDMKNFLVTAIEFLSKRRRYDRKKEKPPKTVVRDQVERISDAIRKSNLSAAKKTRILRVLEGIEESALSLVMVYRNLASLGITVLAVAHEITNPISTIGNYSKAMLKMIQSKSLDLDEFEKAVGNIRNNILRISEFIDFIVAYNRRKRRKRLKTNMQDIVNGILEGYRAIFQKRRIEVKAHLDKELKDISIYRGDFESILINFITNSLEALSFTKGKRLIKISIFPDEKYLYVKFSDNGKGIPVENREIIFEPFFSTKEDGTGLGLKIVKEIVQEYGGTIQVIDSELDNGASFEIKIPIEGLM